MEKIKVVNNEAGTISGALGIPGERLEEMEAKFNEKANMKRKGDGFDGFSPSMLIEIASGIGFQCMAGEQSLS